MELPPQCIKHKRKLHELLVAVKATLAIHNEVIMAKEVQKWIEGMCPAKPIVIDEE